MDSCRHRWLINFAQRFIRFFLCTMSILFYTSKYNIFPPMRQFVSWCISYRKNVRNFSLQLLRNICICTQIHLSVTCFTFLVESLKVILQKLGFILLRLFVYLTYFLLIFFYCKCQCFLIIAKLIEAGTGG